MKKIIALSLFVSGSLYPMLPSTIKTERRGIYQKRLQYRDRKSDKLSNDELVKRAVQKEELVKERRKEYRELKKKTNRLSKDINNWDISGLKNSYSSGSQAINNYLSDIHSIYNTCHKSRPLKSYNNIKALLINNIKYSAYAVRMLKGCCIKFEEVEEILDKGERSTAMQKFRRFKDELVYKVSGLTSSGKKLKLIAKDYPGLKAFIVTIALSRKR